MSVEKLLSSFCRKHGIRDPRDVVLRFDDDEMLLNESIDVRNVCVYCFAVHVAYSHRITCVQFYGFIDGDEIQVEMPEREAPNAFQIHVRFSADDSETHSVTPVRRRLILSRLYGHES